jgi:hypothetical protein
MAAVKYDDLFLAFDFVSFGSPMEHEAYIDRSTGKIYWVSETSEDELPEDLEESDHYIAIPHKNDLDLGTSLALRFAADRLPDHFERVKQFFRKRGAYARFKDLLSAEGRLDEWYAFEENSTETALRTWCEENDITIVEKEESA